MQGRWCWGQYGAGALGRASPTSWILVSLSHQLLRPPAQTPDVFLLGDNGIMQGPRVGAGTTHGVLQRGKLGEGGWGLAAAITRP